MSQTTVIKQAGKRDSEAYDGDKLRASIDAACSSVNLPTGVAADTANHVVTAVELWLRDKPEVTSADIRRIATQSLTIVSPEAGYLYKHHHTMV